MRYAPGNSFPGPTEHPPTFARYGPIFDGRCTIVSISFSNTIGLSQVPINSSDNRISKVPILKSLSFQLLTKIIRFVPASTITSPLAKLFEQDASSYFIHSKLSHEFPMKIYTSVFMSVFGPHNSTVTIPEIVVV